jgi:hypothetical protein
MKKLLLASVLFIASLSAHAQFSVIRGINPSQQFVNLNADASGNIAVNCVTGCSASAGTGGLAANGAAVSGNPVLVAGYDGTLTRTILTDTSGRAVVNVNSLPSLPTGANTIGAVTVSGTPAVTLSGASNAVNATVVGTPAVTLSGASNAVNSTIVNTPTVVDTPSTGALTDLSSTITTGGTSQTLSTAKSRKYFLVQNLSAANLYINFGSAATTGTGSIVIVPNGSFVMESMFVTNQAINILGATTGQGFTAKEF